MLNHGMKKLLPLHMNSILVEAWDKFKVSIGNIVRDVFVKKSTPPQSSRLNHQQPVMF